MRGHSVRFARLAVVVAAVCTMSMLAACGSDDDASSGATSAAETSAAAGGSVAVTLQEFAVSADPATAAAGTVTFDVTNEGPDDVHEFVVVKTDLGITELPTDDKGAVEEEGEGLEPVDEIEDIAVGSTETLTVDLVAGNYVLFCNIYDKSEHEAHYSEGMRTGFTVS